MIKVSGFLTGHLLLALPTEEENEFTESVVFVCRHDEKGAMGFVINQTLEGVFLSDMLLSVEESIGRALPAYLETQSPILWGGPVDMHRGFILHSLDYQQPHTIQIADHYGLTANIDVLHAISSGESAPAHYSLLLGYAGWRSGQLEKEIEKYGWLSMPATPELLFEVPHQERWKTALNQLSIDGRYLSKMKGHA